MIGEKIKELRLEHDLTQEELAKEIYVTRNAISKWENNKGFPNLDSLKLLAKYFDVSLDYLINDEELKELTIKNNEMIIFNKNLIYSIILFIVYTLIGTLLPITISYYDPTSAMALYLILLPVAYIIMGIIISLLNVKLPFVLITGAISTTPILIVYEFFEGYGGMGFYYLIYFIIFSITYLLMSLASKKLDKTYNNKKISILLLVLAISITSIFVIHTLINTILLIIDISSSAAYYTPLVINFFIYIIPIFITWSLYIYYYIKLHKTKKGICDMIPLK